jgi:phenylacetaldehyde dehydrogenase
VLNVVTGDGKAGAALVEHPDVDKVAFTGSTETGKAIVRAAAGNLKRVTLELGGKSPVFVFPDADLSRASPGVAEAVLLNSGQACTAGSRLYIHEDIYDKVVAGVAEYANSLKLGHGLDPSTNLGPLISDRQLSRVSQILQTGIDEGAKVFAGGGRPDGAGFFLRPTVLTNVQPGMAIYQQEIFGPVISAMKMNSDNLDALVREANNTTYGLAASVWTRDISLAHKLASRIRAGVVWVNDHNQTDAALPFGGYKQSGWGREMGLCGIETYTELKSVGVYLG